MPQTLNLHSATCVQIDNEQRDEISPFDRHQQEQLAGIPRRERENGVIRRAPGCCRYNCHGLTFASRRTGIWDAESVTKILKMDGYEKIQPSDVLPGDVLLYVSAEGDIEHSAVVVIKPTRESLNIPIVFSKWGIGPEFIHPANNCPYAFNNHEYYRIAVGWTA